jgi:hypothetical protein
MDEGQSTAVTTVVANQILTPSSLTNAKTTADFVMSCDGAANGSRASGG